MNKANGIITIHFCGETMSTMIATTIATVAKKYKKQDSSLLRARLKSGMATSKERVVDILSMSQRSLSHSPSSKECSLAFMTSEASKEMESFSHVESIATAMRTGKPNRCICSRHLPPPVSELGCYSNIRECRIKLCDLVDIFGKYSLGLFFLLGLLQHLSLPFSILSKGLQLQQNLLSRLIVRNSHKWI